MHLSSLSYQMPNAKYFQNGSLQTTTGYLYKLNIHVFFKFLEKSLQQHKTI